MPGPGDLPLRRVPGLGGDASERGTTMVDLLMVVAVIGLASGLALAHVGNAVADVREGGAARAFAMRIRQVRAEAVRRSAAVGLSFVGASGGTQFRSYADGNANGLRTREIATGVDPPLAPVETLAPESHGVRFDLSPTVPVIGDDEDGPGPGGPGSGGPGSDGPGSDGPGSDGPGSDGPGSGGTGSDGTASDGASGDAAGDGTGGTESGGGSGDADPIRLGAADLLSFGPTGSGTSGTVYLRGPTRQFAVRIYGVTGRIRLLEYRRESGSWIER